jgi:hypothetical protein
MQSIAMRIAFPLTAKRNIMSALFSLNTINGADALASQPLKTPCKS